MENFKKSDIKKVTLGEKGVEITYEKKEIADPNVLKLRYKILKDTHTKIKEEMDMIKKILGKLGMKPE